MLETSANRGERGLEVLHHLYRLCAEALGDLARRVDAGLPGEIDGAVRPIDLDHVAIGGWGRHPRRIGEA